ncbi:helix-turn-helix transcriptional regulator [Beijerinckia indica]|uniref:Transcriptional regulator, LuxR family n=1 Tax=Beijerinckia indica subsp. indica (strain ATCC 9039 / DSM 1715 / NCIMB 8712) TaxID=395963 RepID=B2IF51_BEII9|nr:LuxR C-terminal-related transcriptional regulator [Beijerinckia indica]ACB95616.1 transcriptional regulator, LuxR family [Beijerinckia indica subsp. indica ATCC 9039]
MIDPFVESLIRAIYDCVVDPSGWEEVLRRIVTKTNAVSASMQTTFDAKPSNIARWNVDPFYSKIYLEHFYTVNPFIPLRMNYMAEKVYSGDSLTTTASYRESSFFNEFAKPQEWEGFNGISLNGPGSADVLALMHNRNADFAQTGGEDLLSRLAPHVCRAYDLGGLLAKAHQTTDFLGQAIAAAGFGTVLLSENCRIIYANQVAEDMLRQQSGLVFIRGELLAEASPLTSQLQALVRACVDQKAATYPLGTILKLTRRKIDQPILVHVLPLREKTAAMLTNKVRPVAALFLIDPHQDLSARLQSFANAYALTSVEIAIMSEIIQSDSLTIIAAKLGMAASTLRTHLGRLMAKTGASNRLALLRRFFEMASLAMP